MSDDFRPVPAQFKIRSDGRGGLIKVTLVGEPHGGRALYMDELELPAEIYATGADRRFEWWPATLKGLMDETAVGSDPASPPVHYTLLIPEDTGEPLYVPDLKAG